jgi:hypothetical protein
VKDRSDTQSGCANPVMFILLAIIIVVLALLAWSRTQPNTPDGTAYPDSMPSRQLPL